MSECIEGVLGAVMVDGEIEHLYIDLPGGLTMGFGDLLRPALGKDVRVMSTANRLKGWVLLEYDLEEQPC